MDCPEGQFPNSELSVCVSSCKEGEIKPTNKPACETKVSCTGKQVHNPRDNSCIEKQCEEGGLIDTTVSPAACIDASVCLASEGKFVNTEGTACISQRACTSVAGQVAAASGECQACEDETPLSNIDKSKCISISDCQNESGNPYSVLDDTACITDEECIAVPGRAATSLGICESCLPPTPLVNETKDACYGDSDKDGIADAIDVCPMGVAGPATGAANAPTADADSDGCKNSEDVDDDNDGLIEIATGEELSNIRHNLAGTTYDDELVDSNGGDAGSYAGGPATATDNCDTATSDGVYLCGYELVADIDLSKSDQNGATIGNFDPIGSDRKGLRFTAQLEGNGHSISGLHIDRIASVVAANDHTNDAGLFAACQTPSIRNLTLESPTVKGRRHVGALCGIMRSTRLSYVHAVDLVIQGSGASSFAANMGGLAGYATDSQITDSSASGNISDGGDGNDTMGALAGYVSDSQITDSSASGNISDGGDGNDAMGALAGYVSDSQITDSSASGNISDGGDGNDTMGALVGYVSDSQITGSRASGNISGGGKREDAMGALAGYAIDSQITGSGASGNVSGGGNGEDQMGLLVGYAARSRITVSRASGNVLGGGSNVDHMGGLLGHAHDSWITGSRASANVSDGGDEQDHMGALVGHALSTSNNSSAIAGSSANGNVSGGGNGKDHMGGLVGLIFGPTVRDCFSSSSVCDGSGPGCGIAGPDKDGIGALIGLVLYYLGIHRETGRKFTNPPGTGSKVYNSMAVGSIKSSTGDKKGFIGSVENGSTTVLNTNIANNYFDTTTTLTTTTVGQVSDGVTIADFAGIVGGTTAETQPATAWLDTDTDSNDVYDASSWLATRWLFTDGVYPRLLYFDFDPSNPKTEEPSTTTTIDVCETITDAESGITNDPLVDEGEAGKPDCGDVLEAWPRPADALFNPVPGDLELRENADGRLAAIAIGSPITAYDDNLDAITYSLKADAPAGYAIDSASGQLSYTGSGVDFEKTQTLSLTVIAASIGADGTETQIEQVVTIRIVDLAD